MKLRTKSMLTLGSGLTLAAAITLPAFASGLVNVTGAPTIPAGQVVDGTAYLAGSTVTVQGTINGDLYCGANNVVITGTVQGDVICGASNITLGGQVVGDVRVAGNTVTSTGAIDGSATLAGNAVTMAGGSTLGQDLTVAGNTVDLAGTIGRDARVSANLATVSGAINRDLDGEISSLTVAPGATVGGSINYVSSKDANITAGTVIGKVNRTEPPPQTAARDFRGPTPGQKFLGAIGGIIGFVALAVVVAWLLPRFVRTGTDVPPRELVRAGLVGLLAVVAGPPIILLVFITLIGIPLAVMLKVAYLLMLFLAGPMAAYVVGREVLRGKVHHPVGIMAIGAAILAVATAIPFVGWLAGLAAGLVGVGLVLRAAGALFGNRASSVTPTDRAPVDPADYAPPVAPAPAPVTQTPAAPPPAPTQ